MLVLLARVYYGRGRRFEEAPRRGWAAQRMVRRASLHSFGTMENAVIEANEAFYAAFNAKDIEAMDALWARDLRVACIHPHANALAGREAVMASWRAILGNPAQAKIMMGAASATVLGESAFVVCRELVSGVPVVATNVFVREGGAWRIVHHHASPMTLA